ncbi:hypothetical protein AAOGI_06940 [Agarivorans albus]
MKMFPLDALVDIKRNKDKLRFENCYKLKPEMETRPVIVMQPLGLGATQAKKLLEEYFKDSILAKYFSMDCAKVDSIKVVDIKLA